MPNKTEIWLLEEVKVDEIGWNFHGTIWTQRQTFSSGIHPPGPQVLWAHMQKHCVWVKRLLGLVKQQKESNRVTLWQVNKTHLWQSGHLVPMIVPHCRSMTWSDSVVVREGSPDLDCSDRPRTWSHSSERRQSRSSTLRYPECHWWVLFTKCHPVALFLLLHRT